MKTHRSVLSAVLAFFIVFLAIPFSASAQTADEFFKSGYNKYETGDYVGAIADYSQAIRLKPDYLEAYNNRGSAKNGLSKYIEAITDYTETIRLNPNCAEAYYGRGAAKYNLGRKKAACADFRRALELGYKDAAKVIEDNCR